MLLTEYVLLFAGGAAGISSGVVEPPEEFNYWLDVDGNQILDVNGNPIEVI